MHGPSSAAAPKTPPITCKLAQEQVANLQELCKGQEDFLGIIFSDGI